MSTTSSLDIVAIIAIISCLAIILRAFCLEPTWACWVFRAMVTVLAITFVLKILERVSGDTATLVDLVRDTAQAITLGFIIYLSEREGD